MMTTEVLLSTLEADGVRVTARDGKLKIDAPRRALSAEDRELLRVHKAEIVRRLSQPAKTPVQPAPKVSLQHGINDFIARGIHFAVGAESFELTGETRSLTKADSDYFTSNAPGILCHLQQMLLCREIFDHAPTLLEDFKAEVIEREAIIADGDQELPREVRDEIVTEVTKLWYADVFREEL